MRKFCSTRHRYIGDKHAEIVTEKDRAAQNTLSLNYENIAHRHPLHRVCVDLPCPTTAASAAGVRIVSRFRGTDRSSDRSNSARGADARAYGSGIATAGSTRSFPSSWNDPFERGRYDRSRRRQSDC